jgi:hypothetical protein
MKTTVEISDALLNEGRRLTAASGTTVRALIEEGLRIVLSQRRQGRAFRLRKASVAGKGARRPASVREGNWDQLRALAYEEHGA